MRQMAGGAKACRQTGGTAGFQHAWPGGHRDDGSAGAADVLEVVSCLQARGVRVLNFLDIRGFVYAELFPRLGKLAFDG